MASAVSEKSHTNLQNHEVAKGNKMLLEMFSRQHFT